MAKSNPSIDAMYINDEFEDGRIEYVLRPIQGGYGNKKTGEFVSVEGGSPVEIYRIAFYYNNGDIFDNKDYSETKSIEALRRKHGEDSDGSGKDIQT
jgi:hypothetical protein